jgi:hypothetical protein
MNIKKTLLLGLMLAACSAKGPSHPGATPTGPAAEANAPSDRREGTITSSGGYLYGFETNPWFLQNTEDVKYCVDMDEENFGVSRENALSAITFAIDSWKSQLQKVEYDKFAEDELKPWRELRLGTQTFTEVSCDDQNINLRFQLGKLSETQRAQVGDPQRYVAKAFETSYDEVNMRGEGFIYLAPESGALRPDEPNAHEHFWGGVDGFALKYVLIHELGHVFGFSHSKNFIMAEDGPQMAINKHFFRSSESTATDSELALQKHMSHLFGYSDDAEGVIFGSASSEVNKVLFGANAERDHGIYCEHKSNAYVICSMHEVTRGERGERTRGKKIGHIDGNSFSFGGNTIGYVKIPRIQTVLTISDSLRDELGSLVLQLGTTRSKNFAMSGTYVSEDGKIKMPMRVSSIADFSDGLQVEVVYKDTFRVIAQ